MKHSISPFRLQIFLSILCSSLFVSAQTSYEDFGKDASVIALWATPQHAVMKGSEAHVGLVAYHQNGLKGVRFLLNGNAINVMRESMNPDTGELEFVATFDTAPFAPGEIIRLEAEVFSTQPNGVDLGPSLKLPPREFVIFDPAWKTLHVDAEDGNDANDGSENSPLKSYRAAHDLAEAGDSILLYDGEYFLDLGDSKKWPFFVEVKAAEGQQPVFTDANMARAGHVKFTGITFDWTENDNREIIASYSGEGNFWFKDCTFLEKQGAFDVYTLAIKVWGKFDHLTVENCFFQYLNVAIAGPSGNAIIRGNRCENLTSDAFDVFSGSLVTGNTVTGIRAPRLFAVTTLPGPYDLKGKELTFYHQETKNVIKNPVDLSAFADPSSVSADELIEALNTAFTQHKERFGLRAEKEEDRIKISSLRTNYKQHLYAEGNGAEAIGFPHIGKENEITGSGQHADVFQYWLGKGETVVENMIIRNNIAHSNVAQGWLPQAPSRNIAFFNNLLDYWYEAGWLIFFEKSYDNICVEYNTIWNTKSTLIFRDEARETSKNFVIRNNILGMGTGEGDRPDDPNYFTSHNFYDFYLPIRFNLGEGSLLTNPGQSRPTESRLFEFVKIIGPEATDEDVQGVDYFHPQGDFTPSATSPAVNAALKRSNIWYDVNWKDRGNQPDIGAFERP